MGKFGDAISGTEVDSLPVSPEQQRLLRGLGVTTVEELLAHIRVAPAAMHQFLGEIDLSQLQADASPSAILTVRAAEETFTDCWFALGAVAPPGVAPEEVAQASTFLQMLEEVEAEPEQRLERLDLLRHFGPVRSQGDRGTCVGHAGGAVMECLQTAQRSETVSFSPQFLFYNAKMNDGDPNMDGTWSAVAMPTLQTDGICAESAWRYEADVRPGDVHHGPPPEAAVTDARGHIASEIEALDPRDPDAIKAVIDDGRPVTISVPVYENWWGATTKLTGKIPMPLPYSVMDGGHAMCVAGYDYDEDFPGGGFFILRNSWGIEWAQNSPIAPGYGAIAFEYLKRYGWEAFTARLMNSPAD